VTPLVLLVDDEPAVRSALRRLLEPAGLRVQAAGNGWEALDILDQQLEPVDLLITDYAMPGMTGAELLSAVRMRWPRVARMMLTGNADLHAAVEAVNEGQLAWLMLKPWDPLELRRIVLRLLEEQRTTATHPSRSTLATDGVEPLAPLTPRELDVLRLLTDGRTNRGIGEALHLSPATVKVHVERIIAKLDVSDRTQAAVRAVTCGLLER
jgi:two-component system, NarL family, response regulator LiaR